MRKTLGAVGLAGILVGCTTDNNTQLPPELTAPISPVQESTVQILNPSIPQHFVPQSSTTAPMTQAEIEARRSFMRPTTINKNGNPETIHRDISEHPELSRLNLVIAAERFGKLTPIGTGLDRCHHCHKSETNAIPLFTNTFPEIERIFGPDALLFHTLHQEVIPGTINKNGVASMRRGQRLIGENLNGSLTFIAFRENGETLEIHQNDLRSWQELEQEIEEFLRNQPISKLGGQVENL